jgi:hypothetical protein
MNASKPQVTPKNARRGRLSHAVRGRLSRSRRDILVTNWITAKIAERELAKVVAQGTKQMQQITDLMRDETTRMREDAVRKQELSKQGGASSPLGK